jgi:hypothetical protein
MQCFFLFTALDEFLFGFAGKTSSPNKSSLHALIFTLCKMPVHGFSPGAQQASGLRQR